MILRWLWIILILLVVSCSEEDEPMNNPNPPNPPDPDPMPMEYASHPIEIRNISGQAKFYNTNDNAQFVPRGVNYFNIILTSSGVYQDRFFQVGTFNESEVRVRFRELANYGYNVVRIFLDTCNGDTGCTGNPNGSGLNRSYFRNVARTMQLAKEENIFLILTSNDLPDEGGYWELSNSGANEIFEGYRNAHYLTSQGVTSAKNYWNDIFEILMEENADFSHVMAWSILNEQWYFITQPPFSLNTGMAACANGKTYDLSSDQAKRQMAEESVIHYIDKVTEVIKKWDPNGLVTMGFFAPNRPHLWRFNDFKYVETELVTQQSSLDFYDFHAYPGTYPLDLLVENFSATNFNSKPIIMGEVGAFKDLYLTGQDALQALQNWTASSCELGYDGWLYWGLLEAPAAIGDATWSFLGEQIIIENLSPNQFPDACSEVWLPPDNLALNKPTSSSNNLPEEPSSNAVDGNINTQWGSGDGPPQWIEIDLGSEQTVAQIALVVAQFPVGETQHEILTKGSTGNFTLQHEFRQSTSDNDRLIWEPTSALSDIRYIRINSIASPSWISWKEIEVY